MASLAAGLSRRAAARMIPSARLLSAKNTTVLPSSFVGKKQKFMGRQNFARY